MKRLFAVLAVIALSLSLAAASAEEAAFTLAAPNGAPALAVAALAAGHPDDFRFVAADTIAAEFASAEADFIIAPVNAGAKLYKAGKSTYKLAAVVTWGNLYFASQKEGFSEETLQGADITLFGENTVNAAVTLYALESCGITPGSVTYLAGAANTQALLLTDENAVVLTAEPALSAAMMKNGHIGAVPLNALLEKATGFAGFAQAGLFVSKAALEEKGDMVDAALESVKASCLKCADSPEEAAAAAVRLEILPNEKVALSAIPGCAIRYLSAPEAREQVEAAAGMDLSQFGGALPEDDFYYGAR